MDRDVKISLGREILGWEKSLLAECDLLLVGGAVRDIILGKQKESLDVDYLASGISIDRLLELLNKLGRTDLVGRSFGVIKFKAEGFETVDISLPRTEDSTGTGHRDFDVHYDPGIPIEEDLVRRDYTINSMALDLRSMRLIDPLGGRDDLKKKILRVNRENSFTEDALRILRGVQFLARFKLSVEKTTMELMKKHASALDTVSFDRIRIELNKMMILSEKPSEGFIFMHDREILRVILPELEATWGIEQNEYHVDDIFHHSVRSCDLAPRNLELRWAALLHDLGKKKMKREIEGRVVFYRHEVESAKIAEKILKRLVFPSNFIAKVVHLIFHHMFFITEDWSDSAVRRFIVKVGTENIDDLFALRMADGVSRGDGQTKAEVELSRKRVDKILAMDSVFKRKELAINGNDVIRITGICEGKKIGEILGKLLDTVLENPEYNTVEKLEDLVKRAIEK